MRLLRRRLGPDVLLGKVPLGKVPPGIVLLAVLLLATPATGDDLDDALKSLQREASPEKRLILIRKLELHDTPRTVAAIEKLVRTDAEVGVRVAAARALGRSRTVKAPELLVNLVLHGGPWAARRAVAAAVRRHDNAVPDLVKLLERRLTSPLERRLIFEAFGTFRDEQSYALLATHAGRDTSPLRHAAIRALMVRKDRRSKRVGLIARLLVKSRDFETILTLLDVAESVADPLMKPAVLRLTTYLDPLVKEAANHLLARIELAEAKARPKPPPPKAPVDPDDRYADPGDTPDPLEGPPPDPIPRGRYDLVYVMDATGSSYANIPVLRERILRYLDFLVDLGSSVRVGLIAFRGTRKPVEPRDLLPLTFDRNRVRRFLDELDTGGVDERGAAVARALHNGLDQMNWRARAQHRVMVFADARVEDPGLAKSIVSIHWRADKTRTGVAYILRTRKSVPAEFAEMARLGGTGTLELMK